MTEESAALLVGSRLLLVTDREGLSFFAALGAGDLQPVPLAGCDEGCPGAQGAALAPATDGRALVVARRPDGGADLWITDGTGAGTHQVERANTALVHVYGGMMYEHATIILGRSA